MSSQFSYKKTSIGEIPEDWKVVRLGDSDIAQIIMGQSPPSATYNKDDHGIPFLQGKAEFREIYPSPIIFCSKPLKIAKTNDILLSVRAPVGDVNIAPFECCIGRGLAAIRPHSGRLHHLMLFYYLKLRKRRLEDIASGSTFKAIKKNDIEKLLIPLPPLPEQKKIAEILSTVDKAIEKVDQVIGKTERLKKGLLQELLTKGIGHTEFRDTEIGRIPKDWKVGKLANVGKIFTGKTPPTSSSFYWNGNIPFITPADMKNGKYVYKTERCTTLLGAEYIGNILPKDTVLVVCIGSTIGKTGMTVEESVTNQQINAIVCGENANSHYLYYAISFRARFLKFFSGVAAVPIIKKSLIEQFKISLPPLPEQKKIAEILSTVDKRLELLRKKKEKLGRVKKGLMNDLLTGRRRVSLLPLDGGG
jgi:type I restriction enzyme S subunit